MDRIDLSMDYVAETDKAMLLSDGNEQYWIPKSLMEDIREKGPLITFTIPEWFAYKEGLI